METTVQFPPNYLFGPLEKPDNCSTSWSRSSKFVLGARLGYNPTGGGTWSQNSGLIRLVFVSDHPLTANEARVVAYTYLPLELFSNPTTVKVRGLLSEKNITSLMSSSFISATRATGTGGMLTWRQVPTDTALIVRAGETYTVGLEIKVNSSPTVADGSLAIRLDNRRLQADGMMWTLSGARLTQMVMHAWYGGSSNTWTPKEAQTYYVQNFKISL